MNTEINELKTVQAIIQTQPAVSILLPFEPQMGRKAAIEDSLQQAVTLACARLLESFPSETAMPVIRKLNHLLADINYCSFAKSIAIFVSVTTEKKLYLNIALREKVVIGDFFRMRNLLYARKPGLHYLVLALNNNQSKIFLGEASSLRCIKLNKACNMKKTDQPTASITGHNPLVAPGFMEYTDTGLGMLLKSYPYPVFLMGTETALMQFLQVSRHAAHMICYIDGDFTEAPHESILSSLQHYLTNWQHFEQSAVLQQVQEAMLQNRLLAGTGKVQHAAALKNNELLVVEQDDTGSQPLYAGDDTPGNSDADFYIKDATDRIIEKMLCRGIEIAVVGKGQLHDYGGIALITERD